MRFKIYISAIVFTSLLLGFRLLTNPVIITGHLRKNPKDTTAYVKRLTVFVKAGNKIVAKAMTNNKGDFEMTFTPGKEKSFDFYCTGAGIDTMLIASVTAFESDTPEMTFYIPAQPKRNALGKIICLICKRADKVYKIQYGPAPVMAEYISHTGDTIYSRVYKGTYRQTSTIRPAKYFCDRDKVKF